MPNLVGVVKKHHIPSLTSLNVGCYLDTVENKKKLLIKDIGLSIPYDANTSILTTTTTTAKLYAAILKVEKPGPCDECTALEYIVKVVESERTPGVGNSEIVSKLFPYAGRLEGNEFTLSSGNIVVATADAIASDIVDQISTHNNDTYGPHVTAARAYKFTGIGAAGSNVVLTSTSLGIDETIDHGTYGTAALKTTALIAALNATGLAVAFPVGSATDAIWVIPIGANDGHFVSTTDPWGTATNLTETALDVDNCYIGFYGTDGTKGIHLELEPDGRFTKTELQAHSFASLTPDDVFNELMFLQNEGSLAQYRRLSQPLNEAYTKYAFKWQSKVPSLSEGAGHYNDMLHEFHLYIPTSQLSSNKWDATDLMYQTGDSGFTADSTWAQMLTWWQNSAAKGVITTPVTSASILLATAATSNGVITVSVNNGAYIWMFNVANLDAVDTTGAAMQAVIDATPGFASTTYTAGTDTLLISGTVSITSCTVTSTCGTTGTVTIV